MWLKTMTFQGRCTISGDFLCLEPISQHSNSDSLENFGWFLQSLRYQKLTVVKYWWLQRLPFKKTVNLFIIWGFLHFSFRKKILRALFWFYFCQLLITTPTVSLRLTSTFCWRRFSMFFQTPPSSMVGINCERSFNKFFVFQYLYQIRRVKCQSFKQINCLFIRT